MIRKVKSFDDELWFQNRIAALKQADAWTHHRETFRSTFLHGVNVVLFVQVSFVANTALVGGSDFFAETLSFCGELQTSSYPPFFERELPHNQILETCQTSTSPAYLLFDGADTQCLRRLGDVSWLFKTCDASSPHNSIKRWMNGR